MKRSAVTAAIAAIVLAGSLSIAIWSVSAASSASVAFTAPSSFTTGTLPFNGAVADLNLDHIPDIAVVNNRSNTVSIFLGNGNGTFTPGATYSVVMCPVFV